MCEYYEYLSTRIEFSDGRELFAFPIDGKDILKIATVARIRRVGEEIEGFQRNAVRSHIREIAEYIKTPNAMIPNAIVLAFSDPNVSFEAIQHSHEEIGKIGIFRVPVVDLTKEERPGFIIDGQQRARAIDEADVESFPIMVCAFKEATLEELTQQFVNLNNTKPLPKELMIELLPNLSFPPTRLQPTKLAAELANQLAFREGSPFHGLVRSVSQPEGIIRLNSIVNPLKEQLKDPTSYFGRSAGGGEIANIDTIRETLSNYWHAIKEVFSHAWGLPIKESRLMHGSGIFAMFQLCTNVLDNCSEEPNVEEITKHISLVAPHCHWTEEDGDWDNIDGCNLTEPWNGLENTAKDKKMLTGHLIRKYVEEFRNAEF